MASQQSKRQRIEDSSSSSDDSDGMIRSRAPTKSSGGAVKKISPSNGNNNHSSPSNEMHQVLALLKDLRTNMLSLKLDVQYTRADIQNLQLLYRTLRPDFEAEFQHLKASISVLGERMTNVDGRPKHLRDARVGRIHPFKRALEVRMWVVINDAVESSSAHGLERQCHYGDEMLDAPRSLTLEIDHTNESISPIVDPGFPCPHDSLSTTNSSPPSAGAVDETTTSQVDHLHRPVERPENSLEESSYVLGDDMVSNEISPSASLRVSTPSTVVPIPSGSVEQTEVDVTTPAREFISRREHVSEEEMEDEVYSKWGEDDEDYEYSSSDAEIEIPSTTRRESGTKEKTRRKSAEKRMESANSEWFPGSDDDDDDDHDDEREMNVDPPVENIDPPVTNADSLVENVDREPFVPRSSTLLSEEERPLNDDRARKMSIIEDEISRIQQDWTLNRLPCLKQVELYRKTRSCLSLYHQQLTKREAYLIEQKNALCDTCNTERDIRRGCRNLEETVYLLCLDRLILGYTEEPAMVPQVVQETSVDTRKNVDRTVVDDGMADFIDDSDVIADKPLNQATVQDRSPKEREEEASEDDSPHDSSFESSEEEASELGLDDDSMQEGSVLEEIVDEPEAGENSRKTGEKDDIIITDGGPLLRSTVRKAKQEGYLKSNPIPVYDSDDDVIIKPPAPALPPPSDVIDITQQEIPEKPPRSSEKFRNVAGNSKKTRKRKKNPVEIVLLDEEEEVPSTTIQADSDDSDDFVHIHKSPPKFPAQISSQPVVFPPNPKVRRRSGGRRDIERILSEEELEVETKRERKRMSDVRQRVELRMQTAKTLRDAVDGSYVINIGRYEGEEVITIPKGVGEPTASQREALTILWNHVCIENTGFLIAMAPGMGKTMVAISFIQVYLQHVTRHPEFEKISSTGRCACVLVPSNLIGNWVKEFQKWLKGTCPQLFICKRGEDVKTNVDLWRETGGVLIMSKQLSSRILKKNDTEVITALHNSDLIVVDEAHDIRRSIGGVAQLMDAVKTRRRIALTGSPFQNRISEYWHLWNFVNPNFLGNRMEFKNQFENPIQNGGWQDSKGEDVELSRDRMDVLRQYLRPMYYRRLLKSESLPEMTDFVLSLNITDVQKSIYTDVIAKNLDNSEETRFLNCYHKCVRVLGHPEIFFQHQRAKRTNPMMHRIHWNSEAPYPLSMGYKILLLLEITKKSVQRGERLIIFSQAKKSLHYIENILKENDYDTITYQSPSDIDDFSHSTDKQVLLMNIKSGSLGHNITMASRMIIFDPTWNPTVEAQSAGRIHRKGQTKRTFIYRFVTSGTSEDHVYKRAVHKEIMANGIVDEITSTSQFKKEDLSEIFPYKQQPPLPKRIEDNVDDDMIKEIVAEHPEWFHHVRQHREYFLNASLL
ncbi:DNA excision repair protein ERCC-6-like [Planoprotostelium fungivorum]|uniref:DNA excision repair protein ERCC-6-like n=1 Tax=Planoprotostelium fungivorum TaxID=1890364 RepID=A0A2P6MYS8_9EUKA|nr:DNA excision repair protein ERCC-6-like [Planoprotostelium fungivorum]